MLNRYAVDRSYWQGALKINEALRHVAVSFTTGAPETMLELDAVRLLPWFGVALVVAAGALLWQGRRGAAVRERRSGGAGVFLVLVYLSTCLLVPLLAVLLLASRTPKFNPRYLMLVSPAYLLILAGGIGALAGGRIGESANQRTNAARSTQHAARSTLAVILSAFLIATSVIGLRNWFTDPAFTKAQWRELAGAVRAQIAPDEAVLLVSGHASPAWDYYAPDIPRTRPAGDRYPGCGCGGGFRGGRAAWAGAGRQGGRVAGLVAGCSDGPSRLRAAFPGSRRHRTAGDTAVLAPGAAALAAAS